MFLWFAMFCSSVFSLKFRGHLSAYWAKVVDFWIIQCYLVPNFAISQHLVRFSVLLAYLKMIFIVPTVLPGEHTSHKLYKKSFQSAICVDFPRFIHSNTSPCSSSRAWNIFSPKWTILIVCFFSCLAWALKSAAQGAFSTSRLQKILVFAHCSSDRFERPLL